MNKISKKNNQILKELGIILWKCRYLTVFSFEHSMRLWLYPRFLLISEFPIVLEDPFIKDIVQVMRIDMKDVWLLTINQIKTLEVPSNFSCHCWWIGVKTLYDFRGICLNTPVLSILKCDIKAKKKLWRDICCTVYNY